MSVKSFLFFFSIITLSYFQLQGFEKKDYTEKKLHLIPGAPVVLPDGGTKVVLKKKGLSKNAKTNVVIIHQYKSFEIARRSVFAFNGYIYEFRSSPEVEYSDGKERVAACYLSLFYIKKEKPLVDIQQLKKELWVKCVDKKPCFENYTLRGKGHQFINLKPIEVNFSNYQPKIKMNVVNNFSSNTIMLEFKKKKTFQVGEQRVEIESFGYDHKQRRLKLRVKTKAIGKRAVDVLEYRNQYLVVMLGDSTTRGGIPEEVKKKFDTEINELNRSPVVINSGKGGDTAINALKRMQRDVLHYYPDVVTVSFGLNDTGFKKPKEYKEGMEKIIGLLSNAGVNVVLQTSTPFVNNLHFWGKKEYYKNQGGLDEYLNREYCEKMRVLSKERKLLICDLHKGFLKHSKAGSNSMAKFIQKDGVHLTQEGNRLAAKLIYPVLNELISK